MRHQPPTIDIPPAHPPAPYPTLDRALLEQALDDLRLTTRPMAGATRFTIHTRYHLAHQARVYILDDDDEYPFAFIPLCLRLGLDPHAVRRILRTALDITP